MTTFKFTPDEVKIMRKALAQLNREWGLKGKEKELYEKIGGGAR